MCFFFVIFAACLKCDNKELIVDNEKYDRHDPEVRDDKNRERPAGHEGIDPDAVVEKLKAAEGVVNIHHLHIWPISTTETALTAHVVIADSNRLDDITYRLKEMLRTEGIAHSTLELETPDSHCSGRCCGDSD